MLAPRLTTSRLLLRELRADDFEAYAKHVADPAAMQHMGGAAERRRAWTMFASIAGAWTLMGAGWWAVELQASGEFIGTVGAFFRESAIALGPEAELELGWSLLERFWRRGYATEAARAALEFGLARHPAPRAIAQIDRANVASAGVAKAIGMTYDREVDFYGQPISRWVISRDSVARARGTARS